MKGRAYLASEDSAALRSALSRYHGRLCLEIGAGNGGNLNELTTRFDLVAGTDLVKPSTNDWRESGANYVIADAASCFRGGVFDLVTFNPPYLPSKGISDAAVDGGSQGLEVAMRFLRSAIEVVKTNGKIVVLLSSCNPVDTFETACAEEGWPAARILERRLFFETLYVYEISNRRDRGNGGISRS